MTNREQSLSILLMGLIFVGVGGAGGYLFVYEPIRQKNAAADMLEQEIVGLNDKLGKLRKDAVRVAETRRRSLPADEALARREYALMMDRLLRQANVPPGFTVTTAPQRSAADSRSIPQIAPKKPAFTRIVTEIEFRKADMWAVHDFLKGYYNLNLLHQITAFSIKKDDDPGGGRAQAQTTNRKDLTVKLTSEAIILDGAEPRRTLLPVSNAFAGAGGWAGFNAVALSPEAGRGLTPLQFAPVLSPHNRDYSYIVLTDMFHGPLPKPQPLRIDRIANVSVDAGVPIPPVKVPLIGDPGYTGPVTLSAVVEGSKVFPAGSVKVDQTARTLTFGDPVDGGFGTETVRVVARAENGEEAKAEFKVSIREPVAEGPAPKIDISPVIKLVIAGTRSDGTAFATIRDNANRWVYDIEATSRRVEVTKFYYLRETKKKDPDYDTPEELLIADEATSTNRRFRVVAVDADALLLIDLNAGDDKPAAKAPPIKGRGFGPPRKFGPLRGPAPRMEQGPADPLAVVVGTAAAVGEPKQPTLYRWESGKSLAELTEVPKDEARKLLQRAAEVGPAAATLAATAEFPVGN